MGDLSSVLEDYRLLLGRKQAGLSLHWALDPWYTAGRQYLT